MIVWWPPFPTAPERPGPAGSSRPYVAGTALFAVISAVFLLALLATRSVALLPWVTLAAGFTYSCYAISGLGRDPVPRVSSDGARVTVRMRRLYTSMPAVFTLSLLVLVGSTLVEASDGPVVTATSVGLALACLVVLPDVLWAAFGRHHVSFDPDTIRVRWLGSEAAVDWDDLVLIAVDMPTQRRPAITLAAPVGAPSLTWRRRRILVPIDPRPRIPGTFEINAFGLDEPWLLFAQLAELLPLDRHERERYLLAVGTAMLTGRRAVPPGLGQSALRVRSRD